MLDGGYHNNEENVFKTSENRKEIDFTRRWTASNKEEERYEV